jgi:hypothetical protein
MKCAPAVALSVLGGLVSIALRAEGTPQSLRASRTIACRLAIASEQTLVHSPTGFAFPVDVGPFRRDNEMRRYDSEGRDVSMGYNVAPHSLDFIALTVYVYPAPDLSVRITANNSLDEHFRQVKADVLGHDPGARLLYEQTVGFDQPLLPRNAKRAVFATTPSWGPSFSEALLFRAGKWFVLYRASYRQSCGQHCGDRVRDFVLSLRWPDSLLEERRQ